ncbi:MAG: hypothetical protein IH914_01290 [candidate division Zixibacteria bacterium]|nr:hypothetical protein [candidate division Zixibacteria bacterium]
MPKRKENERFVTVGSKNIWDPFGLQTLAPEKFCVVASLILSGKHDILTFANRRNSRFAG